MKRFHVLDALRFLLALCVVIGHAGMPPLFGPVGQIDTVADFMARAWRTSVYGPAAVIAFFVISGFCIHYPFAATDKPCLIARFYARRYIRILVPVMGTVLLFKLAFPDTVIVGNGSILWHSMLWSIVCEEIYYALYPALNRLARQSGWVVIVAASYLPAILTCWYFFPAVDWQDIGVIATAVVLFPIWLSGCYLAEHISEFQRNYTVRQIWLWRFAAWATMWIALILHSHTNIHQTVSGLAVGIVYYFWIRAEIAYYRNRSPWKILVWGGKWSYSLYLIHTLIIAIVIGYGLRPDQSRVDWIILLAATLIACYLFYLAVERPSHRLARRIPLFARAPARLEATAGELVEG